MNTTFLRAVIRFVFAEKIHGTCSSVSAMDTGSKGVEPWYVVCYDAFRTR